MSSRACILAVGMSFVVAVAVAQPVGRGVPIQTSPAKNGSNTLHQIADPSRNTLRRFEEDASRAFEIFNPAGADQLTRPLPPPVTGPVVASKKVRELLEKKRNQQENWVFLSPEEQMALSTWEEMSADEPPDEQGQKPLSPQEKFYQRLGRLSTGATNRLADDSFRRTEEDNWQPQPEDRDKPTNPFQDKLQDKAQRLQDLLKEEPKSKLFPELKPAASFSDPLNQPLAAKTREDKAQEQRLDQFRQMLQVNSVKPIGLPGLPAASGNSAPATLGGDFLKPAAPPPITALPGASLQSRTAIPEIAPPVAPPPSRSPTPFSSPFNELPRRKF